MANEGAKKRVLKNAAFLSTIRKSILGSNAVYLAFRVGYLWASFSGYHCCAFVLTSLVYLIIYAILRSAAAAKYDGRGVLVDGGMHDLAEDLNKGGMIEYTWDMLLVTVFVQLATAFLSDYFWLLFLLPPSIGFYYLWIKVIYPWISAPEAPTAAEQMRQQAQGKGGRTKYAKAR